MRIPNTMQITVRITNQGLIVHGICRLYMQGGDCGVKNISPNEKFCMRI